MLFGLARRLRGGSADEAGLSLLRPRIVVFGVGGAGGNAVNNMITADLKGVEFVSANTDAQALSHSLARRRLQMGRKITEGLGAGARPEIGRLAAEEAADELVEQLGDSHMAFITAGMGGGTGTGAAPVIARVAREHGILTVGVVTTPFAFEGPKRMAAAEAGVKDLEQVVDTLLVIPNENLFKVASEKTSLVDAFRMADDVLLAGVSGITDLMVKPGLVNLDFADIRTVMGEMGRAMMGSGEAEGEERAVTAAEAALANPLLANVSLKGALGVLVNVTGGRDITLHEIDLAVSSVRDEVDPNANLIFGSAFDDDLDGRLRVTVFATGIGSGSGGRRRAAPASRRRRASRSRTKASATGKQADADPPAARSGQPGGAEAQTDRPNDAGAAGAPATDSKPRVEAVDRKAEARRVVEQARRQARAEADRIANAARRKAEAESRRFDAESRQRAAAEARREGERGRREAVTEVLKERQAPKAAETRAAVAAEPADGKVMAVLSAAKKGGAPLGKEELRQLSDEIGEFFLIEEVIEGKKSFKEHNKIYGASTQFVKDMKKLRDLGLVTYDGDDIDSCQVTELARQIYGANREGAENRAN